MSDIRRQVIVEGVLAAAVANNGTVTIAYPAGTNQAFFTGGNASATGQLVFDNNDVVEEGAGRFSLTYNGGDITLTNLSGGTWPAGRLYRLGLAFADQRYFFSGQKSAAFVALTDSSGGTAGTTIAAIGATYTQAEVRNAVATLAAQIERLRLAIQRANIIE
jgi:hypothetical protein